MDVIKQETTNFFQLFWRNFL